MADMLKELRACDSPDLVQQILRALRGIRYGSIELVVHDGRVVQIERKEKLRFERSDPRRTE
ncbi:MAG: YezD family protein [Gammaproteobacteria bacterium]|nr:YezD family protein [Gammaproteobacteria bacterium]